MSAAKVSLTLAFFARCFFCASSDYTFEEQESNFFAGNRCIAKLDLPEDYDRLKLPATKSRDPLHILIEMDIRQVSEVIESKKSYTLGMVFYLQWKDERLVGQTNKTNCNPVFPHHVTPEFWIPGEEYVVQKKFEMFTTSSNKIDKTLEKVTRNPDLRPKITYSLKYTNLIIQS